MADLQPHNALTGYMLRQLMQPQRGPYINWFAGQDAQDFQKEHPESSSEPQQETPQGGGGVNQYLQAAITAVHEAMLHEQDHAAVATLAKCQAALTGLQKEQAMPKPDSAKGAIQSRMYA